MDPLLMAGFGLALALALVAVLLWRRQRRRHLLGELALLPARVQNPRQFQGLKRIRVWELEVDEPARACQWARETQGRRFPCDGAVPLPIAGCGTRCTCHYLPITENRKRRRRRDPIEQPILDFEETGGDRRHRDGRRKEDHWHQGQR